jgi:hypothetical protein
MEYQSVCPFVGIGSPPPASECGSSQDPSGEETHSLAGEGGGGSRLFRRRDRHSGTLCILKSLYVQGDQLGGGHQKKITFTLKTLFSNAQFYVVIK